MHRSIGRGLDASKFVAIVLSPKSVDSEWCQDELASAFAKEKQTSSKVVLPLLLESVTPPAWLRDRIYLDFSTDRYYESLMYLAGVAHGIPKQSLALEARQHPLKDIYIVGDILSALGWDGTFYVDPTLYEQNLEAVRSVRGEVRAVVLDHDYDEIIAKLRAERRDIDPIRWPLE